MTARLDRVSPQRILPGIRSWILVGLVVAAIGGAVTGCGGNNADADAIRSLVSREVAAINAEDLHALSEVWAQDNDILLFDVPPPGRFRGWEQIARVWKGFFDRVSDLKLAVSGVQVEAQGSLGYATYDWTMTGRLDSYALQDRGQATAIYRKKDGQWRLVHAHFSPVPPALAGQEPRAGTAPAAGAAPSSSPTLPGTMATPAPSPVPSASPPGTAPRKSGRRKSPP